MATSRREPQPIGRLNRNMSPVLKPSESEQGLRRARSVPSSPDRRSSASAAASSSSNACRPSSSFNPRSTASSRSSTSGSASSSSSTHGKSTLLHSVSAMVGAKQAAGIVRRRADKSAGATSVRPHALTTLPSTTSPNKDPASRAAKSSSSNAQRSKLSTRPGAEKTAASSPKPRTQKATTGAAGKTRAASSVARNPGATAKRRTGLETSAPSIQRTTSVPVAAASKAEERDMELLMEEFDEMESVSTPSIEDHLQQRLPDPADVTAYTASEDASSAPSCNREEHENDQEPITEHTFSKEKHGDLSGGGDDADAGLDGGVVVGKEAVDNKAEMKEAAREAGLKESVAEKLNETTGGIESKGAVDKPELNEEAGSETALKDAELLLVKEEAEADEERVILPATKTAEAVQRWRDDGRSDEATEEGGSKTAMQERRNRVMALVGKFETAMTARE